MTCVALFDFDASFSDELSFKKGDQFGVTEKETDGWWLAKSLSTNKEGYIPGNYVMPVDP